MADGFRVFISLLEEAEEFPKVVMSEQASHLFNKKEGEYKNIRTFFQPSSNVFLTDFIVFDRKLTIANPIACLRRQKEETDDDEHHMFFVAKTTYYSTLEQPQEKNSARDLELERCKERETLFIATEISRYWFEWDLERSDDFYFGLSIEDEECTLHFYFWLYPHSEFKNIFELLENSAEWTVKILRNLESLAIGDINLDDFDEAIEGFDKDDENLYKTLIEQAFNDPENSDRFLCPEKVRNLDKATNEALCFIKNLIEETGYKKDERNEMVKMLKRGPPKKKDKIEKCFEPKGKKAFRKKIEDEIEVDESFEIEPKVKEDKKKKDELKENVEIFTTDLTKEIFINRLPQLIGVKTQNGPSTSLRSLDSPVKAQNTKVFKYDTIPLYQSNDNTKYIRWISLDLFGKKVPETFKSGDYVRLHDELVIRIVRIYNKNKSFYIHGPKFIAPKGNTITSGDNPFELVDLGDCVDRPVTDIFRKVYVEYIPHPQDMESFRAKTSKQLTVELNRSYEQKDHYFVTQRYDENKPAMIFSEETAKIMRTIGQGESNVECWPCLNKASIKPSIIKLRNDYILKMSDQIYKKGDCVLLADLDTEFESHKKKESIKQRYAIDMEKLEKKLQKFGDKKYTEFDRWTGHYTNKGNKNFLKELFVLPPCYKVGIIKEINIKDENNKVSVSMQMFYRPEDTFMTDDQVRNSNSKELFLSDEVLIYDSHEFDLFLSHVYVKTEQDDKWLQDGPMRFFCTQRVNPTSFLPDSDLFFDDNIANALEDRSDKSPTYPKVDPLICLDLFAGVGGLSLGLEQSGVAESKWAVEYTAAHAKTNEKNAKARGKDVAVFADDVNGVLRDIKEGKLSHPENGKKYPQKGMVGLIVGGPPCQGFSALNSSKHGEDAAKKRSLVSAFMGAVDLLRPMYVIMENVGGMQNKVNNVEVLALLLECLRAIGYQVTLQYLQAAQYGVPQDRKRVFIIASAPCVSLPNFPLPTCSGWSRNKVSLRIGGVQFKSPCYTDDGAGIFRPNTIGDAISDLAMVPTGYEPILDLPVPLTFYQKQMRGQAQKLTDHLPKIVDFALLQKQMDLIPNDIPRADWRLLPDEIVSLNDNKKTVLLDYSGRAKIHGQWKPNRALCPHMEEKTGSQKGGLQECKNVMMKYNGQKKNGQYTLIPWCLPHTSETKQQWDGLYGRVYPDDLFDTIVCTTGLINKQGRRMHMKQNRTLTLREMARAQGFPDSFRFDYHTESRRTWFKHANEQIGNAVPPPLAKAFGHSLAEAMNKDRKKKF